MKGGPKPRPFCCPGFVSNLDAHLDPLLALIVLQCGQAGMIKVVALLVAPKPSHHEWRLPRRKGGELMAASERFKVNTKGNNDIIDVTAQVSRVVANSGLKQGVATVFVMGSTAGITTMEYEPGLVADMQRLFERLAPASSQYQHNLRWGDLNGHSHLRASILGASLALPFDEGQLQLGTWQQIVVIDFDVRPRSRTVIVQVVGE